MIVDKVKSLAINSTKSSTSKEKITSMAIVMISLVLTKRRWL